MPPGTRENRNEHTGILSKSDFDLFFRENYQTACLVALRYISDINRAEDIVQDVFVVLWEKRERLNVKTNLSNYFFAAIKNQAINMARRTVDKAVPISLVSFDLVEEEDLQVDEEQMAIEIGRAIGELPVACRRIFSLAYLENYTYQEIAEKLAISKNTVKTQMGIAYQRLRIKLEKLIINLLSFFFSSSFN